jgi:hypothetical protein
MLHVVWCINGSMLHIIQCCLARCRLRCLRHC